MSLRLIFMGTPSFCLPTLQALINSPHTIAAVYSQPPRPSGRGQRIQKSSVHTFADTYGLPVFTPPTLKNESHLEMFASHKADLAIVIAYGLILPAKILDAPRLGCLNVHASLLPRWRGAAPIARTIEAGDAETGISIMKMDAGLDTGPVLAKNALPVPSGCTAQSLQDALSTLGAATLMATLDAYAAGTLKPVPQPDQGITYAHKLSREEGQIDWQLPASVILRKIRAFSPWPGMWFMHEGVRLKVPGARIKVNVSGEAGEILDDELTVACGEDALSLTQLQRPGGSILATPEFLKGYSLRVGTRLPCPVTS